MRIIPNNLHIILSALFALCILTACGEKDAAKIANDDEPYDTAYAFFDLLYNEKNLDAALLHVTPRTARIMEHYKTAKAVQRHILNMKYDEVNIVVNKGETKGSLITGNEKKANVNLMFDGTYEGSTIRDMKTVEMIKLQGKWKINEIKADPFN